MKTSDPAVIVEQVYPTSKAKVWAALTQVDQMHQWFFGEIVAFEPTVGFTTEFNIEVEDRSFVHLWKIVKSVPEQELVVNWNYQGMQGDSNVHFKIDQDFKGEGPGEQTKLVLECEILEDFPEEIPEFRRESCVAGWEYFIQGNLKDFLSR